MKKSKILMAASALLLTVVGVAVTKANANKKFAGAAKATYRLGGSAILTLFSGAAAANLTAGAGNGKTAKINTGSVLRTLLTAGGNTSNKLHYIN